jgi:hypothetical protein
LNGGYHILLTDHRLNSPPEAMFYKHFLMTTFSLFRYPMVNITLKAQKSWKWTGNILVFSRNFSAIDYRLGEKFTSSCERVRDCQLIAKTDAVHSVVDRPFQSHSLFTLSLRYLLHLPQPHYPLPPSPSPHPRSSRTTYFHHLCVPPLKDSITRLFVLQFSISQLLLVLIGKPRNDIKFFGIFVDVRWWIHWGVG